MARGQVPTMTDGTPVTFVQKGLAWDPLLAPRLRLGEVGHDLLSPAGSLFEPLFQIMPNTLINWALAKLTENLENSVSILPR